MTKLLPNLVTVTRVALCPLAVAQLLGGNHLGAMVIFTLACLSDGLDGYLARRLGAISALGSILDPLCDKIYIAAFLSALMTLGLCPPWFLALYLTVTIALALGWLLTRSPERVARVRPIRIGKWNTAALFAWIGFLCAMLALRRTYAGLEGFTQAAALVGYSALAALQMGVLLRYFLRFRHAILPEARPASA